MEEGKGERERPEEGLVRLPRGRIRELIRDPETRRELVEGVVRFCCALEGHEHMKIERKSRLRCPRCKSKALRVEMRHCNYSAFSGYKRTPSRYSALRCLDCGAYWRTRANVAHLEDYYEPKEGRPWT